MAVSRAAIERAGLLDEELFAYVEDVDWCLRIRDCRPRRRLRPRRRGRGTASRPRRGGAASPTSLLLPRRNMLAVCERYRPLPRGLTGARRALVVGTHLAQALAAPRAAPRSGPPSAAGATTAAAGWAAAERQSER